MATRRKGSSKKRAARAAADRPERKQDPRLWAVQAFAQDGVPFTEETWMVAISPARLPNGEVLHWHPPMPVAFNLIQAQGFRQRGVKSRERIMGHLKRRRDDASGPSASTNTVIDCIFDLQTAVLCSFLAIESLANHAIENLPDGTTLAHNKKVYDKDSMIRQLSINDKLKKVMPKLVGGQPIAGDAKLWGRYCALKELRDELVHIKHRGLTSDPDEPSAYDRLLLGEADGCVETAIDVVEGTWPELFPTHVRQALRRR